MQTKKFKLLFTPTAASQFEKLQTSKDKQKILKAVRKTLCLMETNLRHPSLNTHQYQSWKGPSGEKIFESYVQNQTPGAYRIFWYYGPSEGVISIFQIVPHP